MTTSDIRYQVGNEEKVVRVTDTMTPFMKELNRTVDSAVAFRRFVNVGSGMRIADVTNVNSIVSSHTVSFTWNDPEDLLLNGAVLSRWAGTTVVRKEGSAPSSISDGTVIVESTVRNAHASTPFVDSGLDNLKTYFYRFFPHTEDIVTDGSFFSARPDIDSVSLPTADLLEYNGSAQAPVWSYDTGKVRKITESSEVNAGTYTTVFSLIDPENSQWTDGSKEDKTVEWTIARKRLRNTQSTFVQSGTIPYTGEAQSPEISGFDPSVHAALDISETEPGVYTAYISLLDPSNYVWYDGGDEPKAVIWEIQKTSPNLAISKDSMLLDASNLSETVTVTYEGEGELSAESSDSSLVSVFIETDEETGTHTATITTVESTNTFDIVTVTFSVTKDSHHFSESVQLNVEVSFVNLVLADNSWETISSVAKAGKGDIYWDIGDRKEIVLEGVIGENTYTPGTAGYNLPPNLYVFILDFNHADNGIEDNNIIFGGFSDNANPMNQYSLTDAALGSPVTDGRKVFNMNHWADTVNGYNYGGWKGSDLRYDILGGTSSAPSDYGFQPTETRIGYDATEDTIANPVENTLMAALPAEFREVLRLWTRYVDAVGGASEEESQVQPTVDAITLLTEYEVFGSRTYANDAEQNHQVQMQFYVNGGSVEKGEFSGNTWKRRFWFLASPAKGTVDNPEDDHCFCGVTNLPFRYEASISYGIAPAFKL